MWLNPKMRIESNTKQTSEPKTPETWRGSIRVAPDPLSTSIESRLQKECIEFGSGGLFVRVRIVSNVRVDSNVRVTIGNH